MPQKAAITAGITGAVTAGIAAAVLDLTPWQPISVRRLSALGGNVGLDSPGTFSGGCVNGSARC